MVAGRRRGQQGGLGHMGNRQTQQVIQQRRDFREAAGIAQQCRETEVIVSPLSGSTYSRWDADAKEGTGLRRARLKCAELANVMPASQANQQRQGTRRRGISPAP